MLKTGGCGALRRPQQVFFQFPLNKAGLLPSFFGGGFNHRSLDEIFMKSDENEALGKEEALRPGIKRCHLPESLVSAV